MSDAQRTHKPSDKRKREFRKRGEIAMSRDLVSAASLGGAVLGLAVSASSTARSIADLARGAVQSGDGRAIDDIGARCAHTFIAATAPVLIGAALGAVIATLAQVGWPPGLRRPSFDLGRLSPGTNLKNVFSPGAALRRVGGALLKLSIIGVTVVVILRGVDHLEPVTAAVAGPRIARLVLRVLLAATCAFAAVAVIDYVLTRRKLMAKMRMTPDEVKREFKEQEGDPTIKGQRKRKARELAKRRVATAVKSATVVIVNPTHYAVALRYDDGTDRAPIVVAKGVDASAERIRELARHHGVPILSRPPLARALHKAVPEGREVPVALYRAVAEVLAYVYRLKQPRSTAT